MKKSKTRIEKSKITKKFWINLSAKEKENFGREAGDLHEKIEKDEEEFAGIKKTWQLKISQKSGRLGQILKTLKAGKEHREFEVEEFKDFGKCEIRWVKDGKVLDKREMTPEERQTTMSVASDPVKEASKAFLEDKPGTAKSALYPGAKTKSEEIKEVISLETRRATKKSSLDQPTV